MRCRMRKIATEEPQSIFRSNLFLDEKVRTTEKTLKPVLYLKLTATMDVENIDTSVMKYWCQFMV